MAKPVANVSFDIEGRALVVRQIQGVRRNHCLLGNRFKWERMLLKVAIDWTKELGLERIEVIRATESSWYPESMKDARYSVPKEEDEKRAARMHMRYDVTPRRMGFKLDQETGRNFLSAVN